jgi:isocitrate dehydrogenase kinase/phosphatase
MRAAVTEKITQIQNAACAIEPIACGIDGEIIEEDFLRAAKNKFIGQFERINGRREPYQDFFAAVLFGALKARQMVQKRIALQGACTKLCAWMQKKQDKPRQ